MAKRIVVRRKPKYVPPKLPAKPKVTVGTKSYGRSKSGGYIVCRFWITQNLMKTPKKTDPWYVVDMETGNVAKGTKAYPQKDQAIAIARKYRDKYGAWFVMPF
jgi:hypothetical protein